jgi:hypothetical protein
MSKRYWIEMSEKCFHWHEEEPDMRWEVFMYFYLFKWAGYEE